MTHGEEEVVIHREHDNEAEGERGEEEEEEAEGQRAEDVADPGPSNPEDVSDAQRNEEAAENHNGVLVTSTPSHVTEIRADGAELIRDGIEPGTERMESTVMKKSARATEILNQDAIGDGELWGRTGDASGEGMRKHGFNYGTLL